MVQGRLNMILQYQLLLRIRTLLCATNTRLEQLFKKYLKKNPVKSQRAYLAYELNIFISI